MKKKIDNSQLKIVFKGGHQGETIIIRTPSGKWGLIDCYSKKADDLVEYLKENNINEIEFLCITHPHTDHYKGIKNLIEKIDIKNVYLYESLKNTILLFRANFAKKYNDIELITSNKELREAIELIHNNPSISLHSLINRTTILNENGLEIKCIAPSKGFINHLDEASYELLHTSQTTITIEDNSQKKANSLINSYSGVIILKYKNIEILFAADAEKSNWEEIASYFLTENNNITVYKVSHHGSENGITELLLGNKNINENSFSIIFPFIKNFLPDNEIIDKLKRLNNHEILTLCSLANVDSRQEWENIIKDSKVLTEYDNYSSIENNVTCQKNDNNIFGIIEMTINNNSEVKYKLKGNAVKL